jgi:hypothetical protein
VATSPVGVDAEAKTEVRTVVFRDDALRVIVVELEACLRHFARLVLDRKPFKTMARVAERKSTLHR